MAFTTHDYEKLQQLMNESPENKALLQKLLDSQQYTISKISHEIRNPLTLVYSTLQLIETEHPETKTFRHWKEMRQDVEFTISLLQELSSYNNSERMNAELFSSFDLLSHICLSFAASCADSGIHFTSKIPETLPAINGDRIKLQEVFLNLLRNARDAVSSDGTIRLEADCITAPETAGENDSLKITISDNGCGIPTEQLEEIFEAFVTHKKGGTGLGLAIAKRTVEAHYGCISVESQPGKGSRFTVQLPVL